MTTPLRDLARLPEDADQGAARKQTGLGVSPVKEALRTFLNIRLTSTELAELHRIAEERGARRQMKTLIYPLILAYLRDCADSDDRPVLLSPKRVAADEYWGTQLEVIKERHAPAPLARASEDRGRFSQQILKRSALEHLRAIERFYRISLNDLAASPIEWALS